MILPVRGATHATSDVTVTCGVYSTLAPKGLIIDYRRRLETIRCQYLNELWLCVDVETNSAY